MRLGYLVILATIAVFAMQTVNAAEEIVVKGYEAAFDTLRDRHNPNYHGATVEAAIKAMFEEGDEYKGTYSPTDYWKRDGDIRRKKPDRLRYQGQFFFKYSQDDISEVEKWEKELELTWRQSDWSGKLRFSDVSVFAYQDDPMRWEKANIRYKNKSTKVTVGSFGALFGRGLAVNMFEDRTLDFDNEIEGIKIEHERDDVEYTVLSGSRKKYFEPKSASIDAARVEFPIAKGSKMGFHVADLEFINFDFDPEGIGVYHYKLTGGDLSYRLGDFRVAFEAVRVGRDPVEFAVFEADATGADGRGYYVNAGYNGDGYSVNAEYKDYDAILQPFSVLPPLRSFREQATADPYDDKGYAVGVNWNPFGDGSYFDLDYAQGNSRNNGIPYREIGAAYFSPPTASTTWVLEYWDANVHGDTQVAEQLTVSRQLNSDWVASTYLEHEVMNPFYRDSYTDYILEGELAYRSLLNLIYTYERSGIGTEEIDNWGIWEVKFRPDDAQEINLVLGSRREGYVCSGGVCRLEPAFDGVRIDYLHRF